MKISLYYLALFTAVWAAPRDSWSFDLAKNSGDTIPELFEALGHDFAQDEVAHAREEAELDAVLLNRTSEAMAEQALSYEVELPSTHVPILPLDGTPNPGFGFEAMLRQAQILAPEHVEPFFELLNSVCETASQLSDFITEGNMTDEDAVRLRSAARDASADMKIASTAFRKALQSSKRLTQVVVELWGKATP